MNFFKFDEAKTAVLPGDIVRKVLAYSDDVMTTYWKVPAGSVIPPHEHPHEQFSIIISGSAEYTIDGEKHVLRKGDSALMPPNVPHQVTAIEEIIAIDIFAPIREDFLT